MMIKFSAKYFDSSSEDEVLTVGLADSNEDPQGFLIFQRAEEVDEQDEELDQDTYYVEVGNPSLAGYGGVEEVRINKHNLIFIFSSSVDWCESIKTIEVQLDSQSISVDSVESSLKNIFAGEGTKITRS